MSASRNVAKSELVSAPVTTQAGLVWAVGRLKNCAAVADAVCCCWAPVSCCDCWRNKNGCLDGNMREDEPLPLIMSPAVEPPPLPPVSMTEPIVDVLVPPFIISSPISSCLPRRKLNNSSLRIVRRFFFFNQPSTSLSLRCWPAAMPSS